MAIKTAGGNSAFHNTVNDFAHIEDVRKPLLTM
jgi:PHS family inorganic phosphate transporter-like MFS transporter